MNNKNLPSVIRSRDFKIRPFAQGLKTDSIAAGDIIIELFNKNKFNNFFGISAFTSETAINGIKECIDKGNFSSVSFITGIDNVITTRKTLEKIEELTDNSYIYYQKESPLFHPKIYIFEGDKETAIINGSINCTVSGFYKNVESFDLIEFGYRNNNGIEYLNKLKEEWNTLFNFSDSNLFKINSHTINYFVSKKIVPDGAKEKRIFVKSFAVKDELLLSENLLREEEILNIPSKKSNKVSDVFSKKKQKERKKLSEYSIGKFFDDLSSKKPLWISKPLKMSELNISDKESTNTKGSMLFSKGKVKEIDPRHYFRDVVFSKCKWENDGNPKKYHIERSLANFKIVIDGLDFGTYGMKISHNTKTDTPTYEQMNSMTKLSWGDAVDIISRKELLGKTAKLYKGKDNEEFILSIQ